jgi:hypothetical protein
MLLELAYCHIWYLIILLGHLQADLLEDPSDLSLPLLLHLDKVLTSVHKLGLLFLLLLLSVFGKNSNLLGNCLGFLLLDYATIVGVSLRLWHSD